MTYQESVAYLEALAPRGWRLGLDRMTEFSRRAGLDGNLGTGRTKYIHIAGTNGKGSVTAYVQSLLVEAGYRTGAFFSPFVYDLRERVQYGRELIPEDDFARIATELRPVSESFSEADFGGVTEFEFKTAIGFQYWTEMECDYVALEVGLGGRLDSTNIVDPACSVIVSIGLDHTAILGETHVEIAAEKAGIIKPGRPVIVGSMPLEASSVIERTCLERGSACLRIGRDFPADPGVEPGIRGTMQRHNLALAIAAVEAAGVDLADDVRVRGAKNASAPGRFEVRRVEGRTLILDGAHNFEAAEVLAETLREEFPGQRFALITGMVQGHDPRRFYQPLQPMVTHAFAAPIDFHRALSPEKLCASVDADFRMEPADSVEDAIVRAKRTKFPILVTGSFYLVGAVGRLLRG